MESIPRWCPGDDIVALSRCLEPKHLGPGKSRVSDSLLIRNDCCTACPKRTGQSILPQVIARRFAGVIDCRRAVRRLWDGCGRPP